MGFVPCHIFYDLQAAGGSYMLIHVFVSYFAYWLTAVARYTKKVLPPTL